MIGKPITTCELAGRYLSVLGACGTDSVLLQPPSILCSAIKYMVVDYTIFLKVIYHVLYKPSAERQSLV